MKRLRDEIRRRTNVQAIWLAYLAYTCKYTYMANKTLYIKDSDLPLWDLAQAQLGGSISGLFAEFLRERVKTMSAFVHVLRSAPSSQDLVVMFAPVGSTGSGGPSKPQYVREPQLVEFLQVNGVTPSVAGKIASDLRQAQSVSELTIISQLADATVTVPQRVAAFLKAKAPVAFCDECIATLLELKRHQQAQQATSGLAASDAFTRHPGTCVNCHKSVLVTHAYSSIGRELKDQAIDNYTLELKAPSEPGTEIRCIATNTNDDSTAQARMNLTQANELLSFLYGNEQSVVSEFMRWLADYGSVELFAQPGGRTRDRLVVSSQHLVRFSFNQAELRPWRDRSR